MKPKHIVYALLSILLATTAAGAVTALKQNDAAFTIIFTSFFWLLVFLIATVNDELN
jgi:hypothetical protein